MAASTRPFSRFEFLIAWRYLRARRAEGGVSVMTWISLIGITLGVMALVATLAVRTGFRTEFVDTILGANAHVTLYSQSRLNEFGVTETGIPDYEARAARVAEVDGVTRAAPLVRAQGMLTHGQVSNVAEVFGILPEDLLTIPRVAGSEAAMGDISRFGEGIAIGAGIARELGLGVGDRVRLMTPNGTRTPMGVTPRVSSFEVVYIFTAGRYDIDRTRVYMPLDEAQAFFNREGLADEIEIYVADPERVTDWFDAISAAAGEGAILWSWQDSAGAFLGALEMEDNVMFLILSILVLIASMNITSGLVMLVKNKGRDIGILRTIGLSQGSILRVFFICGAFIGVLGTVAGVGLGALLAIFVEEIMAFLNWIFRGGAWDPSVRGIYELPAILRVSDVARAVALSLGLSFIVTVFPARRAARLNPVEALRGE